MKCRITNNVPNSAQKRALRKMVGTEFNGLLKRFNRDALLQFAYVLRFNEGYGYKKLKRVIDSLTEMQKDLDYRYELEVDDTAWLCEQKLRESGIDVDTLLGEDNG